MHACKHTANTACSTASRLAHVNPTPHNCKKQTKTTATAAEMNECSNVSEHETLQVLDASAQAGGVFIPPPLPACTLPKARGGCNVMHCKSHANARINRPTNTLLAHQVSTGGGSPCWHTDACLIGASRHQPNTDMPVPCAWHTAAVGCMKMLVILAIHDALQGCIVRVTFKKRFWLRVYIPSLTTY